MAKSFSCCKVASGLDWLRGHFFDWLLAGVAIAAAVLFVASLLVA